MARMEHRGDADGILVRDLRKETAWKSGLLWLRIGTGDGPL